ncbi:MAG: DUF378 domain-containing protein [Candidatus Magasanikbacteria bacterium]|nr:DUF378 domain-containing protein [Candidatus Magasanikbacteria bacterium]
MCPVHKTAALLVWVGALNWGLVGAFNFNLVNAIFGSMPTVERVIYILVGIAALAIPFKHACSMCKQCKMCDTKMEDKKM